MRLATLLPAFSLLRCFGAYFGVRGVVLHRCWEGGWRFWRGKNEFGGGSFALLLDRDLFFAFGLPLSSPLVGELLDLGLCINS